MTTHDFEYGGVLPILPTPFLEDDRVDFDGLLALLAFCREVGVDGVTILGVLGEANMLTDAEAHEIIRVVCDADLGLPVIVGASRPGAQATRSLIEFAARSGADAVMVTPPTVQGISEATVFRYFADIATTPLPVVVQDHPASSRVHMSADLIVRIIEELPQVGGVKCEAVPAGPKIRAIKQRTGRVPILTGLGALYATTDLAAGADGFNTGFAFPEVLRAIVRAFASGDLSGARALYRRFLPLIVFEQHPGPGIRKEIWRRRGVLSSARVRPPAPQLDPWMAEQLTSLLEESFGDTDLTRPVF